MELMVVIAIMVALMGIGIPSLYAIFDIEQRSAARELALTYRFLLNEASLRNVTFRIAYDLDAGTYQVQVGDPRTLIFGTPEERAAYEEQRERELRRFTQRQIAEGEGPAEDPSDRFANLPSEGFDTTVDLPTGSRFAWVWTPQYGEAQVPSEEAPEDASENHVVYTYVFASGEAEHAAIRIVSAGDPEDGYSVEVEPLTGQVTVTSDLIDPTESMAWLPREGPTFQ